MRALSVWPHADYIEIQSFIFLFEMLTAHRLNAILGHWVYTERIKIAKDAVFVGFFALYFDCTFSRLFYLISLLIFTEAYSYSFTYRLYYVVLILYCYPAPQQECYK